MLTRSTATRLLASTALTTAAVGAMLGVAGPAAAASNVTVTLNLQISGTSSNTGYPVDSVNVRTYDSAGRQVGGYCVTDPARGATTERRTITPAGGFAVSVPAGGSVAGRAAGNFCWDQTTVTAPTTFRAGTTDATVSWYLQY